MALETVGIRAIIDNLQGYISGSRQMQASTAGVAKAQVNLEKVTIASAAAQERALASVAAAERNLAAVSRTANRSYIQARTRLVATEDAVARRIAQAELRVQAARARSAVAASSTTAVQQRASISLAAAEQNLSNVQAAGAARVVAAQEAVKAAYTSKVERIIAAEAAVAAATARSSSASAASATRLAAAQEAATAATARQGIALRSLAAIQAIYANTTKAAAAATTRLGEAMIAVTGFSNRMAVAVRFGALAFGTLATAFAVGAASSFETSLARIDVLTDATAADVAVLKDELQDLAATVPQSPNDLGATAYFVLSSGVKDLGQALKITELSAKASTIGLGQSEDVARTLTSVINAYGAENISAAEATDILVAAVQQGSAEASDFSEGIGRLLGIAPVLGIQFEQLAANLAALTNAGLDASQATTAILGIMNQLVSPSNEAQETLKKFGTSIEEVRKNIREKGLNAALADLIKNFEGNIQAFETLFPEVRGLTGALILFAGQAKQADAILNTIRKSAGITEDGFERMSQTFGAQVGILRNQLNIALISLGDQILPILTRELQKVIKYLDDNREGIKNLAEAVVKFVTGAISVFITGISSVNKFLSFIPDNQQAIIAAIAAIGVAMVLAFGPQSAALIGLIAIIGALEKIKNGDWSFKLGTPFGDVQFGTPKGPDFSGKDEVAQAVEAAIDADSGIRRQIVTAIGEGLEKGFTLRRAVRESGLGDENVEKVLFAIQRLPRQDGAVISLNDTLKTLEQKLPEVSDTNLADEINKAIAEINTGVPDVGLTDFAFDADDAKTAVDALSDGIIDFAEATELGIDAITAGAFEAAHSFSSAQEEAFNFTKMLSRVANAFQRSEQAAQKLVLALAKEALAKVKAAQQELFGAPTREVADLEVKLAQANEEQAIRLQRLTPVIESYQDQIDALKELEQQKGQEATDNPIVAEVIDNGLQDSARNIQAFGDNIEEQIQKLEDLKKAAEDELEQGQRKVDAIVRDIDVLTAHSDVLNAQITAANQLLLTQAEQEAAAKTLIDKMKEASSVTKDLSDQIGEHTLESFNELETAFSNLEGALGVLNDEGKRSGFLRSVDEATGAQDNLTTSVEKTTEKLDDMQAKIDEWIRDVFGDDFKPPQSFTPIDPNLIPNSFKSPATAAIGDLVTRPQLTLLGENSRPELVLPLMDKVRSRELIRSLPAHLASGIFNSQSGPNSIFGDLNVQGESLESMRLMARSAVDSAFRSKRREYHRRGLG